MTHRTDIDEANKNFMAHFGNHDATNLAGLYTDNGQVMAASAPIIEGQTDIANFWQSVFDAGIATATLETVELDGSDTLLTEVGRYTLETVDGSQADEGSYIVIWHNIDGQWKLHRDMFNSSIPES